MVSGIYQDPIGGYRLSINGNVRVIGDLCFYKEGSTDTYCLQDLIFIKSLETNTLQLSTTNKLDSMVGLQGQGCLFCLQSKLNLN